MEEERQQKNGRRYEGLWHESLGGHEGRSLKDVEEAICTITSTDILCNREIPTNTSIGITYNPDMTFSRFKWRILQGAQISYKCA